VSHSLLVLVLHWSRNSLTFVPHFRSCSYLDRSSYFGLSGGLCVCGSSYVVFAFGVLLLATLLLRLTGFYCCCWVRSCFWRLLLGSTWGYCWVLVRHRVRIRFLPSSLCCGPNYRTPDHSSVLVLLSSMGMVRLSTGLWFVVMFLLLVWCRCLSSSRAKVVLLVLVYGGCGFRGWSCSRYGSVLR